MWLSSLIEDKEDSFLLCILILPQKGKSRKVLGVE